MPGLRQSIGIPNSAFSPFSLFISIPWHPHGDSQPWHRVVQRCSESQRAAPGVSPSDPPSHPEGKPGKKETLRLQNQQLIDSLCSGERTAQLFNSHPGHLSMFSYRRISLPASYIWEKTPQNYVGEFLPSFPCLLPHSIFFLPFSPPTWFNFWSFGWVWLKSHEALPSAGRSHTWLSARMDVRASVCTSSWQRLGLGRELKGSRFAARYVDFGKRKERKGGKKSSAPKALLVSVEFNTQIWFYGFFSLFFCSYALKY